MPEQLCTRKAIGEEGMKRLKETTVYLIGTPNFALESTAVSLTCLGVGRIHIILTDKEEQSSKPLLYRISDESEFEEGLEKVLNKWYQSQKEIAYLNSSKLNKIQKLINDENAMVFWMINKKPDNYIAKDENKFVWWVWASDKGIFAIRNFDRIDNSKYQEILNGKSNYVNELGCAGIVPEIIVKTITAQKGVDVADFLFSNEVEIQKIDKILIGGVGGIGNWVIAALPSFLHKNSTVYLVDPDNFEEKNTNRQWLGKMNGPKVDIAAKFLKKACDFEVNIKSYQKKIEEVDEIDEIVKSVNLGLFGYDSIVASYYSTYSFHIYDKKVVDSHCSERVAQSEIIPPGYKPLVPFNEENEVTRSCGDAVNPSIVSTNIFAAYFSFLNSIAILKDPQIKRKQILKYARTKDVFMKFKKLIGTDRWEDNTNYATKVKELRNGILKKRDKHG